MTYPDHKPHPMRSETFPAIPSNQGSDQERRSSTFALPPPYSLSPAYPQEKSRQASVPSIGPAQGVQQPLGTPQAPPQTPVPFQQPSWSSPVTTGLLPASVF